MLSRNCADSSVLDVVSYREIRTNTQNMARINRGNRGGHLPDLFKEDNGLHRIAFVIGMAHEF